MTTREAIDILGGLLSEPNCIRREIVTAIIIAKGALVERLENENAQNNAKREGK